MSRTILHLAAAGLVSTLAACTPAPTEGPDNVTRVLAVLPVGDATAGRADFIEFRCNACHTVAGETEMAAPIAAVPGPELPPDRPDNQSALVSSIIAPSHVIAAGNEDWEAQGLSRMGDFTEVMTVRQLVDLVAYLESLR